MLMQMPPHMGLEGDGNGSFGFISIDTGTGEWSYQLNNDLTSTQELQEGETVTETFTAIVTDDHGLTAQQVVTVDITGTNDAPVISPGSSYTEFLDGTVVSHEYVGVFPDPLYTEDSYSEAPSPDGSYTEEPYSETPGEGAYSEETYSDASPPDGAYSEVSYTEGADPVYELPGVITFGGDGWDACTGTTILSDGSTLITGYFSGTIQIGDEIFTGVDHRDAFVAKLNPDGS